MRPWRTSTRLAARSVRQGHIPPGLDPAAFLLLVLFQLVTFAPLVAAGLYFRRRPQTHKRLMLLATISLLGAPSARVPPAVATAAGPFVAAAVLLVVGLAVYDVLTRRRVHPATLWGGLFAVASAPLSIALGGTAAWLAVARWLLGR